MTNLFGVPTMTFGNVSDVLLKSQQLTKHHTPPVQLAPHHVAL